VVARDASGSIVLSSTWGGPGTWFGAVRLFVGGSASTSIPVTLRSLVRVSGGRGFFSGVMSGRSFGGLLTGGNGRSPGEGQADYYKFNVDRTVNNISAEVSLTTTRATRWRLPHQPRRQHARYGQNNVVGGASGTTLTAYTLNPVPGVWTLIVDFAEPVVGDEISQLFTGTIQFNSVRVTGSGFPTAPGTLWWQAYK